MREAATKLGLSFVGPPLDSPFQEAEYRRFFEALRWEGANGLMVVDEAANLPNRRLIAELAEENRLPAVYPYRGFVEVGGLISYGPDVVEMGKHLADLVDQVLRGAKPGEIPISQPMKFELFVNLKTARSIDLTIPASILARADEVIE